MASLPSFKKATHICCYSRMAEQRAAPFTVEDSLAGTPKPGRSCQKEIALARYVFAVGDDANLPLLRMLSRNNGAIEHVLSTEPLEFKLNAFVSKIGRSPVAQLRLGVSPESAVESVYPLQDSAFAGSMASWVGQYKIACTLYRFHGARRARW